MSLAAKDRPCQYCSKPVGYGDHEKYCSENPVNLARNCDYVFCTKNGNFFCKNPGNISTSDYTWICKQHSELKYAKSHLKSAEGNLSFAKSSMERLQAELLKLRISIPQMMIDETEASEHLKRIKFKLALQGTEA